MCACVFVLRPLLFHWGGGKMWILKLASAIFYQIFIFHQMIEKKTMKNVFYFIQKALFVLEIFKFLCFCLPLSFSLSAIALEVDPRKILKLMMSSTV